MQKPTGMNVTDEQRNAYIKSVIEEMPNNRYFTADDIAEKTGYPSSLVGSLLRRMEQRFTGEEERVLTSYRNGTKFLWDNGEE